MGRDCERCDGTGETPTGETPTCLDDDRDVETCRECHGTKLARCIICDEPQLGDCPTDTNTGGTNETRT
jgi:hypothetical protein